ncbi:MAG: nucleotidyltransferase family protein [Pseudolabrys sp.]|nr:nucleotidyltransferase family protein [Pseudolabrys sp.]
MTTAGQLPREFVLAAACCRWPPGAARDRAVAAAATGIVDWDRFLRVVRRQRVDGLVHAALAAAAVALPAAHAQALASRAQWIARQNLALTAETVRLQGLFAAADIPILVVKGVALARAAYGSVALKHSKDIDIWVAPERALQAWGLLETQGYGVWQPAANLTAQQRDVVLRYGREIGLAHPAGRIEVELRWQPVKSPTLLAGVAAHSAGRTIAVSDQAGIRTLNDDDLFAYLCVHGAGHGWSRLKWLADLNALLACKDDAGVMHLYRHAQGVGAGVCAGLALLLCQRLLERRLPAELDGALRGDRRLRWLAALALDAMVGGDGETELEDRRFGTTRVAAMQFLLGGGWANIPAQCRALAIRLDDVLRWPLPAPLHLLYPVLRLPLWLWRRCAPVASPRRKRQSRSNSV